MKRHYLLGRYLLICLFAVASLITAYSIVSAVDNKPSPQPINVSSVVSCPFPDKSFCGTEQLFMTLVARHDFSSIVENQTPVRMMCSGGTQSSAYCNGIKDGLVIQLFRVYQGTHAQLLTRNQYITFFSSYFQQQGPFTYAGSTVSGPDVLMRYKNRGGARVYTLRFAKATSTWKLAYPSTNAI